MRQSLAALTAGMRSSRLVTGGTSLAAEVAAAAATADAAGGGRGCAPGHGVQTSLQQRFAPQDLARLSTPALTRGMMRLSQQMALRSGAGMHMEGGRASILNAVHPTGLAPIAGPGGGIETINEDPSSASGCVQCLRLAA
jgi:hypothetical protein